MSFRNPAPDGTRYYDVVGSSIGELLLVSDGEALTMVYMSPFDIEPDWVRDEGPVGETAAQLEAYFAGDLKEFDLHLAPAGTAFQLRVWNALTEIPYGETVSYAEIAESLGKPSAVRAVGAANGRNPIPIIVPCHRVIGADGSLTGYGGGLERKRELLTLEHALPEDPAETLF